MDQNSALLKTFCPKCGKKFDRLSSVRRHQTQPRSPCYIHPRRREIPSLNVLCDRTNWNTAMDIDEEASDSGSDTPVVTPDGNRERDEPFFRKEPYIEYYLGAGARLEKGGTFMDEFDDDAFAEMRKCNLFYPFSSRTEWGLGCWLYNSGLSLASINEFLSLEIIRNLDLSFSSAKELRSRIEMLPGGPAWRSKEMPTENPTIDKVFLYYRNPLQCLQNLLRNPLHSDHIKFSPYRIYDSISKQIRVYTEWLSGEVSWEVQKMLPVGATLLGAILSSDKTCISIMTGNRSAYPLLISLANIQKDYRLKNSRGTFMLLALLPIPKFIHHDRRTRSLLHDRLVHACLDHILQPLKDAAVSGALMSDALGFQRLCFPVLASYTVDTPEAQLLACVGSKSSPLTVAHNQELGDAYQHVLRTSTSILELIKTAKSKATSSAAVDFFKEAHSLRLNGVEHPFWRNWRFAQPSIFLTPEPLHHWHKEFWDHDCKWCIRVLGASEIDFRFALLQTLTGYRQFKEGISKLKQVTGRDQREVERYIVSVIAGGVANEIVLAIRSLMDFRYLGQASALTTTVCRQMSDALSTFHRHKDAIMAAKGRVGKSGLPMNHWKITKLELMHNVVANIMANGAPHQYSADITEHAHITEIKNPARAGNNQKYDTQIVMALDRHSKCRQFDLATSIRHANITFGTGSADDSGTESDDDFDYVDEADGASEHPIRRLRSTSSLLAYIQPVHKDGFGRIRPFVNYFALAEALTAGSFPKAPKPYRTFSWKTTAFRLSRDPTVKKIKSIHDASMEYGIPCLQQALCEYVHHYRNHGDIPRSIGGRRLTLNDELPFDSIQIWHRMRIQGQAFHYPHDVIPAQTLNCLPPSPAHPYGLYDSALLCTDQQAQWPKSRLSGHSVVQLRLLMRPVIPRSRVRDDNVKGLDEFFAYVERFDVVPQAGLSNAPNPFTGMYVLKRAIRSDGTRQGHVIPIKHLRTPVMLVPKHGLKADVRLTKNNALEGCTEFWLNHYFEKEFFYSMYTT